MMRKAAVVVAAMGGIVPPAGAGAGSVSTACRLAPDPAGVASIPGLAPEMREALAVLCEELRTALAGRADLALQLAAPDTDLRLELVRAGKAGMTVRLYLRDGGIEKTGPEFGVDTVDSAEISRSTLHRMADILIRSGPLPESP
ncbi:MAG: hypothetical protein IAE87_14455 [Rhodobacteraceae bacterium]|nr:hypothetical protein [Paracoccaceae bacterium]